MKEVKIQTEIDDNYNGRSPIFIDNSFFQLLIKLCEDLRYILCIFIMIFILSIPFLNAFYNKNFIDITPYNKYVTDCKNLVIYEREKVYNEHPYISICMSAYNMQEYIEKNLISIINQSFQDFEIIIVNDASEDETQNIIYRIQKNDKRIKLLSHENKLGVYRSRIETIFNSKSEYILLMDPDDMYLNENLFKELYDYNLKKNLDIIEFSSLQQIEGDDRIYYPKVQFGNHYHNFCKSIISQPELSNILYYWPNTKKFSRTICRNIWNKMIRIDILIQASNYIGKEYYNEYIIVTDDMILNVITYEFANNYSNIKLPGYLYLRRNISMSRGGGDELKIIRAKNFLSYFKIFYRYIKDYNKDINILFYEMKNLENKILVVKENNMTMNKYRKVLVRLIDKIQKESNLSKEFESYLQNLSSYIEN